MSDQIKKKSYVNKFLVIANKWHLSIFLVNDDKKHITFQYFLIQIWVKLLCASNFLVIATPEIIPILESFLTKREKEKTLLVALQSFHALMLLFCIFFFYHIPVYTVGFKENGTDSCMRICAYRWRLLGCVKNKIKI